LQPPPTIPRLITGWRDNAELRHMGADCIN